jgi:predicted nuclease of predicted toxin-antitoxin system
MKILLDECVTKKLKAHLKEFEVFTVTELGWSGVKNGKLLTLSVENDFDVLLTIDKNLIYQQNLSKYKISIIVFNSITSKIEELSQLIPSFKLQLLAFESHKIYIIDK